MADTMVNPELLAKVKRKQSEREQAFANLKKTNVLDEQAQSIVNLHSGQLLLKCQRREILAKDVLRAYIAKALEVTEKFNCVTEFIPKAEEWASALDNLPSDSPPLPLHGLPFAVKDDLDVEGMDTTLGYAKNLYKPAEESSALVKVFLKLGAIPFCKTNVPQTLFSSGNHNPIFGGTLNSVNPQMVPGGSSTGSASLVAAGGAVFATGSDCGGSLRIPAHFHGQCTIKPTLNRLSGKGLVQCLPQNLGFCGAPGIITQDVTTLSMVWKAMTESCIQNQYDFGAVPIPWNEAVFSSKAKLRIGYFTSMSFFPTFTDTCQTILDAKSYLEGKGHELVPFNVFEMFDTFQYQRLINEFYYSDQGRHLKKMFESEPISYCIAGLAHKVRNPDASKNEGKGNDGRNVIEIRTEREEIYSMCGENVKTADDIADLLNLKKGFIRDLLDRMEKAGVEALISPAYPFPALDLEKGSGALAGGMYVNLWNFCDFPAGVVQFGIESGNNIDSYDDQGETIFKRAKLGLRDSAGMPISVQVISTPFREELVLRILYELDKPCGK